MEVSRREALAAPLAVLAAEDAKGLVARVAALEEAVRFLATASPPVGSVIPYLGKWPAPGPARDKWEDGIGWMLCDGRDMEGTRFAELTKALGRAGKLPDFTGRVARGKTAKEGEGHLDGADVTPERATKDAGKHSHTLPKLTGLMAIIPQQLAQNNKRYSVKDDNAGWVDNGGARAHHIDVSGGNNDEGQHAHELGGEVDGVKDHNHSIPALPCIPSYVAVHYIIKFKATTEQ